MACVHMIDVDRFPLTRCGVDTNEKTGALWTDGEDADVEVTCRNCLKLMSGGHMGGDPPAKGGKKEKAAKANEEAGKEYEEGKPISPKHAALAPYWRRMDQLDRLQTKTKSLMMDGKTALGDVLLEDELSDMVAAIEYLDAADARMTMVLDQVRYRLTEEAHNDTGTD